jgi:Fungal specific transcription factor domain
VKVPHGYAVNLDTLDLALFHHFTALTSFSLSPDPEMQKVWKITVPEMAHTNIYLMHGILACSALHLRYMQPSNQQELTTRAISHQALALPLFRSAISIVNDDTCHAIYAFSRLLVVFAFASELNNDSFLLAQSSAESDASNCLHLIRGGCSMLFSVKPVIEAGPLGRLIPPGGKHPDRSAYCEDPRLCSLGFLPSLEPDEVAWQGMASTIYLDAFRELRVTFSGTYTRGALYTVWDVVQTWPARVSDDFVTLLHDEHPGTLILVAHYCILLKQLGTYWYMEGYAERLLSQVYTRVGPKWHTWMSWPLQDVGLG